MEHFREPPEDGGFMLDTMLLQDPPRHDELRSVVDAAFQPRALRDLEPRIRSLTEALLEDAPEGEFDLVDAVAYPLPVIVIAELLGIPPDEREQFKRWSDTVVRGAGRDEDPTEFYREQREAGREMAGYFLTKLEERRNDPRDDLLTVIATAEGEAGRLSRREALGTAMLLLIAGNVTTTNLVTNAVRAFDDYGMERVEDLAAEGSLATPIEEVLRYRSPVQAMTRVPTEDVAMGGKTLEAGDRVVVWLGSANRDGEVFPDPDAFVPDRSPTAHLGFGHGTHYCLGAPLARLEATTALDVLFDRLTGIEVVDAELEPVRSSFIYGVESLPIRYESAA